MSCTLLKGSLLLCMAETSTPLKLHIMCFILLLYSAHAISNCLVLGMFKKINIETEIVKAL